MPEERPVPKPRSRAVRIPNRIPPRFVSPRGRQLQVGGRFARARQEIRRRRPSTIRQFERFKASDIRTFTLAPSEAVRFRRTGVVKNTRRLGVFTSQKRANETARTASIRLGVSASDFIIVKAGNTHTLFVKPRREIQRAIQRPIPGSQQRIPSRRL